MSKGISFKELQQFFKYTEQAMKDNKTTVIIDNEMCRFLYKYLKNLDSYFNMQDKEIKRLNNIIKRADDLLELKQLRYLNEDDYRITILGLEEVRDILQNEGDTSE